MPEISVIIPMYKTPKLRLRKCLESLMEQTFSDFEALIVDDGNAPEYKQLVDEYKKNDDRFILIRQEHGGVSNARNVGLSLARGKYISFIDSDDFVDASFLNDLYQAIQDSDMAICAVSEQYYPVYPGWVDRRVFLSKPSFYNGIQYINFCHNKLYRIDIIRNNNICFQAGVKLGEDALFIADYLKACRSVRNVREPRYHYVPDSGSAMHRYQDEFWTWERKVMEQQWALFHNYPLSEFEEQAMNHWLYSKLKFSLYYYLRHEKNRKKCTQKMREICKSDLFTELIRAQLNSDHKHLRKKDRLIIKCWKICGIAGIRFTFFAPKVRGRIRRYIKIFN